MISFFFKLIKGRGCFIICENIRMPTVDVGLFLQICCWCLISKQDHFETRRGIKLCAFRNGSWHLESFFLINSGAGYSIVSSHRRFFRKGNGSRPDEQVKIMLRKSDHVENMKVCLEIMIDYTLLWVRNFGVSWKPRKLAESSPQNC